MEEDKDVIRCLLAISHSHAQTLLSYNPNLVFFENIWFEVIAIAVKNLTCNSDKQSNLC